MLIPTHSYVKVTGVVQVVSTRSLKSSFGFGGALAIIVLRRMVAKKTSGCWPC